MKYFSLIFFAVGASISSSYAYANGCSHLGAAHQLPHAGLLLCNENYAVGFADNAKVPLWAAEYLSDYSDSIPAAQALHGRANFHEDARLDWNAQAHHTDYKLSYMVRGHMAPSGDMPTREARAQSYNMTNVIPQDDHLNSGAWEHIEAATRQAALDHGELYVVTGPAFSEPVQTIGPDRVWVPSDVWKVVYDPLKGGVAVVICHNYEPSQCHQTSLVLLRHQIGFDPLPGLSKEQKNKPLRVEGWPR